ncbi:arylsulfatase A-like enzyme [Aliiruegeria haliotis]|uniref:Arylsulfatase A-like enzyme n=1 Tax=Aliiruegeria haliotis TaxID=1280846 RepID=A0A2T0RFN5_9RHOB|nr:sulfatase [Aliiruegeria haliotis]PRY19957.1 arylsulfatase A-like enzyme [Aliiruegeria haliotis]
MRTVFFLMDSLSRHSLGAYGFQSVRTPNFDRLARRSVTFDTHYVGSMPCIPARRDMHTGRLNFLHRSWGPLEPFDDSYAEILRSSGTYTHLVTDHYHYWEDGGVCYHQRFNSYEFVRGQEKDGWVPMVEIPKEDWRAQYSRIQFDEFRNGNSKLINYSNRTRIQEEPDYPLVRVLDGAIDFLNRNRMADNWFLQVECYDPHEPFTAPERFRKDYPTGYDGPILDCPRYDRLSDEAPEEVAEMRANYAALIAMCDENLGRLLDYFDEHDLWKDTALIVTSDHGFLIGEHDWFGKNRMPFYEEISHIPLFLHHPDFADQAGTRRSALTQTMDVMPTILDTFGQPVPADVQGASLLNVLREDVPGREACLFGMFGAALNITDGRYTYFRYPNSIPEQELFEYTLMPTHLRSRFAVREFDGAELAGPFAFSKGVRLLRLPSNMGAADGLLKGATIEDCHTVLYDLQSDPGQTMPVDDPEVEARLLRSMVRLMADHDAPAEAYRRFDLVELAAEMQEETAA